MREQKADLYASFEYNSKAQPPLSFVVKNKKGQVVVKEGMREKNPVTYAEPHMGYPPGEDMSREADLLKVARALRAKLDEAKLTKFALKPGREEAITLDRSTGEITTVTAATLEVRRIIVMAIAELDAEGKGIV
ncbi:MAG: hypothetical protein AAB383_03340 [Patescibacteria group bacterium]